MKYKDALKLIKDTKIQKVLSMPGFVVADSHPVRMNIDLKQEQAEKLFEKIINSLGNVGLEIEQFEFQFASSGDRMLFLCDSTWPKTVH